MPQLDMKYTSDLSLNIQNLFLAFETVIHDLDSKSGACKCRAYPIQDFLHQHVLIQLSLLKQPHRDAKFMEELLNQLNAILKKHLPEGCQCAIELSFLSEYYVTAQVGSN